MTQVLQIHEHDANFLHMVLMRIHEFLGTLWPKLAPKPYANRKTENEEVFDNPVKHEDLIWEFKQEAALITNNSPYAEVSI